MRKKDKENAIKMRRRGESYSQIKSKLNVSKSTLSYWLSDIPLSKERISELRDKNPQRIEKYRTTMLAKKKERLDQVYGKVAQEIGALSDREIFLAGLFLYWGEGTKAKQCTVALTNTNPQMLKFYKKWLTLLNVPENKMKVKLHLYDDMDIEKTVSYWSKILNIPRVQFRKPYIKKVSSSSIRYKRCYKMGTCSIEFDNARFYDYILMGLKYIEEWA